MSLLDLPPEILILILQRLEPDSFALALQACKAVRFHALKSKKLLLYHLGQVPGLPYGLDELPNDKLLALFGKRASCHVHDGADRMADLVSFTTTFKPWAKVPTRNCFVRYADQGLPDRPLLSTAVDPTDASIYIYDLHKALPRLKMTLSPYALDLDDSGGPNPDLNFEVVSFAMIHDSELAAEPILRMVVLYRYRIKRRSKDRGNAFIEAAVAESETVCKLVVWNLSLLAGPRVESISNIPCDAGPLKLRPGPITRSAEGYVVIVFNSAIHEFSFEIRSYSPKELSKRVLFTGGKPSNCTFRLLP